MDAEGAGVGAKKQDERFTLARQRVGGGPRLVARDARAEETAGRDGVTESVYCQKRRAATPQSAVADGGSGGGAGGRDVFVVRRATASHPGNPARKCRPRSVVAPHRTHRSPGAGNSSNGRESIVLLYFARGSPPGAV